MPKRRDRIWARPLAASAEAVMAEALVRPAAGGVKLKILEREAGARLPPLTRLEGSPLAQLASLLLLLIRMSLPICDDLKGLAPPRRPVSTPAPSSWLNWPLCPPPLTLASTACHSALV